MLTLPVLVRGINNLSDARYCAGMGAAGLIFTLDPALPGAIAPETVRELAGWVAGVELLGEFGPTLPAADVNRLVAECGLSRVLLSAADAAGSTRAAAPNELAVPVLPVAAYSTDALAVDLTGRWLLGSFGPADLPALLAARPAGLILEGGDELKPGLRDFTELGTLFEALEVA